MILNEWKFNYARVCQMKDLRIFVYHFGSDDVDYYFAEAHYNEDEPFAYIYLMEKRGMFLFLLKKISRELLFLSQNIIQKGGGDWPFKSETGNKII